MSLSRATTFQVPNLIRVKSFGYRTFAKNCSFIVVGFLLVVASALGNQLCQNQQQPQGVEMLFCPKGAMIGNI